MRLDIGGTSSVELVLEFIKTHHMIPYNKPLKLKPQSTFWKYTKVGVEVRRENDDRFWKTLISKALAEVKETDGAMEKKRN